MGELSILARRRDKGEARTTALAPFKLYVKLLMTGLGKVKSCVVTVWRGVKGNVAKHYNKGDLKILWGPSVPRAPFLYSKPSSDNSLSHAHVNCGLGSRFCTKNRISECTNRAILPYLAAYTS